MTEDEREEYGAAEREVIEGLQQLARAIEAPPHLLSTVLAQGEQRLAPRWGFFARWATHGPTWPLSVATRVAVTVVFVLSLTGAVPQYIQWAKEYSRSTAPTAVHATDLLPIFRIAETLTSQVSADFDARQSTHQDKLWEKNFACSAALDITSDGYATITSKNVSVTMQTCPSGDVFVEIGLPKTPDKKVVWIAHDPRQKSLSRFLWSIQTAFAEERLLRSERLVAQTTRVLCQKRLPDGFIKRRSQLADGRCQDEVIDPSKGRIVDVRDAPCDTSCASF